MSVAGSDTYPDYTFKCNDCGAEFVKSDSEENIKAAKCNTCDSSNVELLYISFPTNGPGYQKNNGYSIEPQDPLACSTDACTACKL